MTFTNSAPHTITAKTGLNYELTVAKQSNGTVVEYCEADLLKKQTILVLSEGSAMQLDKFLILTFIEAIRFKEITAIS